VQALIVFLLLAVVVGNTRWGQRTRRRPRTVLVGSVMLAASFYSLSVVL
jgi:hypothetical protein